jgi:hypothetical protein
MRNFGRDGEEIREMREEERRAGDEKGSGSENRQCTVGLMRAQTTQY